MKYTFILTFLFLFSTNLLGQFFNGGLSCGLNLSELFFNHGYNEIDGGKNKFGYMAGCFTNYNINKKIINQFELNLIQKGHRSTIYSSDDIIASQWEISQTYIEPTFLFKYNPWKKLHLGFGVSFGYLVNTKFVENYGTVPSEIRNLSFTKFDKSMMFELSYFFHSNVELSLRASQSVVSTTHQDKMSYWYLFDYNDQKGTFNEVVELSIYYTINKKKRSQ
jgi:hypothetical protein